jgi:hypothetical protein
VKNLDCSISGCEGDVVARGLCGAHYQRANNAGELHLYARAERPPLIDRTVGKDCPPDHKHAQTHTCYNTHGCRCDECTHAKNTTRRDYDWEDRRRRGRDVWIPATGTMRRLQALAVIGWSTAEIAARMDSHYRPLQRIRAGERVHVHMSTARRVAGVFEELCMHVRHDRAAKIARNRAAAKGWLPPLAWDDIDTDANKSRPARLDQNALQVSQAA